MLILPIKSPSSPWDMSSDNTSETMLHNQAHFLSVMDLFTCKEQQIITKFVLYRIKPLGIACSCNCVKWWRSSKHIRNRLCYYATITYDYSGMQVANETFAIYSTFLDRLNFANSNSVVGKIVYIAAVGCHYSVLKWLNCYCGDHVLMWQYSFGHKSKFIKKGELPGCIAYRISIKEKL